MSEPTKLLPGSTVEWVPDAAAEVADMLGEANARRLVEGSLGPAAAPDYPALTIEAVGRIAGAFAAAEENGKAVGR